MAPSSRLSTYFHLHLVSDSTGETLNAMARAVCARFDGILPIEHIYALVRSRRQVERVLREIEGSPGVVLHTIVDKELRAALEEGCREVDMSCIAALDPLVGALGRYLGASLSTRVGAQHTLAVVVGHGVVQRLDPLEIVRIQGVLRAHPRGQGRA